MEYEHGDIIFIQDYEITAHCKRRWRKRWLDYTPPAGERRIKIIESIIESPMTVIRKYVERDILRVTDYRYEFVVDANKKTIITVYAYRNVLKKKDKTKNKKKRGRPKCENILDYVKEF